jgi:hypothetical protein
MSNLVHQMLNDVKRKFQGGVSPEEVCMNLQEVARFFDLCRIFIRYLEFKCIDHLEDQLQLLYLRSTMLQEVVYQWRNGYNSLDDRRFLSDPKLLATEIRQVKFS